MSTPMDHIAYLSQEIGPRPSGTEEEQQAALYITDRLQKDAHLSANIEDFACLTNVGVPRMICYAVIILAAVLSIVLPVASIPAVVLAALAAAVLLLETFDRPVVSRFFMKGISQNVVGKYEPVVDPESAGARRRKVILVANYDSGKVRRDLARPLVSVRRILDIASLAACVLVPVVILIGFIAFGSPEGTAAIVLAVIKGILAVLVLIPLVFLVMEKAAEFNEAANSNASGVAVMLEVARRLGSGEAGSSPIAAESTMHDEKTARAAGVVPEGASIHYESDGISGASADEKNTLGVMAGAAAAAAAPAGTLAEAAAKAAVLHEQAAAKAAEEAAALERAAQEAQRAAAEAEAQRAEEERLRAEAQRPAGVPDWYKKATEKARVKAEQSEEKEDVAAYRSRYADFPGESNAADDETDKGSEFVDVSDQTAAYAKDETSGEGEARDNARPSEENANPTADSKPHAAAEAPAAEVSGAVSGAADAALAPGATTAMPALSQGGALDLDAMRAAAQGVASAEPASTASGVSSETQSAEISGAATTRLPQLMYYTPPADRSDVIRDRAQKDRVTISADELSQAATMDAAEEASVVSPVPVEAPAAPAVQGVPAVEAQQAQPVSEPRVISANIPVVDLPKITLPPITAPELKPVSFEEFRQRAPLANVAEAHGKDAAKSLLATTLPTIEESTADATVGMPAVQERPQNVSLTGSFAAVEAIGSKPVGDELLEGVDPDDIYVDDADDSAFDAEFTETGAFAGPGYVEMPQSRLGKFFGKFRRNKKEKEESAHEWLGVDEDFDARSVGKARGGWESFREDEDDWQGGAFSSLRARMGRDSAPADADTEGEAAESHEGGRRHLSDPMGVSADEFAAVAAIAASKAADEKDGGYVPHADFDEVQQIYSFASGDINTEVWFVALGSELAGQGGIKAFLADHASDMRGAIIVNLESLGAGDLCYLDHEGALKQMACSPRMKRFIRKATQASGVDVQGATVDWRESPASYAMKHRAQAVTLAGMEGSKPALMGEADDVIENIDEESLNRAADFIVELLKNI